MGGNVARANKMLLSIFELANKKFFSGCLKMPEITIQAAGRKRAYGWCSNNEIWRTKKGEGYYEINLCAEYLARPLYEVVSTLLHEMGHLYNLQHDIKDCTKNQYHNKKFKIAAEMAGLIVTRTEKHGWSKTEVSPETKKWVDSLGLDKKFFSAYRAGTHDDPGGPDDGTDADTDEVKKKKGSAMKKWTCNCTIIRCATKLEAICSRCGGPFVKQEDDVCG